MSRFVLLLVLLAFSPVVAAAQSPVGVWRIVERETVGGPNAGVISGSEIQPGFIIYTAGGHFASVGVPGGEPRPRLSDDSTAEELLEALLAFYGRVSTYEVRGSTIVYGPRLVDQNPNAMLDELATPLREFRITGGRLETRPPPNADGVYNILRYVRVE